MQSSSSMPETSTGISKMRIWITGLILLSTLLFTIGVFAERTGTNTHNESTTTTLATPTPGENNQENQEGSTEGTHTESNETALPSESAETPHTKGETILGIDIENPIVISVIVLGWLALIAGLFLLNRVGLVLIVLAGVASTVFDIGEALFQFGRANNTIAALAIVVAALHASIAILAIWALLQKDRQLANSAT
ncbi:MAG: hypothetical protein ABIQ44_00180 [Chloroflexia bacterium]